MQQENPFKGPKAYEDGDSFFGREKEIKEVYNLIRTEQLTLLFSRSGTGKSSLLKAGIIPFLRKEFEYLPVYIHLNDTGVRESLAANICDFVIKRCKEEMDKHLSPGYKFKIKYSYENRFNSLFEFIHSLHLIYLEEAEINKPIEYLIKPVLIFDQFEEIFTHPFENSELQFLIKEIRFLLESKIPPYLDDSFNSDEDEYYVELKNNLKSKQKNFRIIFSFREEYLPQFESLRTEIPLIRFTNSRYRLEAFSVDTANEVISKTDTKISSVTANFISQNLAVNILSNFEKIVVEPFLLSLVCQKIYFDIINTELGDAEKRIKGLVNNAIEKYIDEVYSHISDKTKEFIERKLITSDNKRTPFNYNDAIKDTELQVDVDRLIDIPAYRLLNKEQFLDSTHIEILHDRLLPPIAVRRDKRLRKAEEEAIFLKQKELERENKAKQIDLERENKLKQIELEKESQIRQIAFQKASQLREIELKNENRRNRQRALFVFVFLVMAFIAGSFYLRNFATSKLVKVLSAKQDSLKQQRDALAIQGESLRKQREYLANQKQVLDLKNASLEASEKLKESLLKKLKTQNERLFLTVHQLNNVQSQLTETNQQLINSNRELGTEKNNIREISERKSKLFSFFKQRSDSLVFSVQKQDPLVALALARSNYQKVEESGINDTGIVNIFKKTFLKVYNKSTFFSKSAMQLGEFKIAEKTGLMAVRSERAKQSTVLLYQLKSLKSIPDTLFIANNATQKDDETDVRINRVVQFGFSKEEDFFYAVTGWDGRWVSLQIWNKSGYSFDKKPDTTFEIAGINYSFPRLQAENRKIVISKSIYPGLLRGKKYDMRVFDLRLKTFKNVILKVGLKENIYNIDLKNNVVITRDFKSCRIYDLSSSQLINSFDRYENGAEVVFYDYTNNILPSYVSSVPSPQIQLRDYKGAIIEKVSISYNFPPYKIITFRDTIICLDATGIQIFTKRDISWRSISASNVSVNYSFPTYSLSHSRTYLAYLHTTRSICILNLKTLTTDSISIPDAVRTLFFNPLDSSLIVMSPTNLYNVFFLKPKEEISTVDEVEKKLNKEKIFGDAWPISEEEKEKYGIEK